MESVLLSPLEFQLLVVQFSPVVGKVIAVSLCAHAQQLETGLFPAEAGKAISR